MSSHKFSFFISRPENAASEREWGEISIYSEKDIFMKFLNFSLLQRGHFWAREKLSNYNLSAVPIQSSIELFFLEGKGDGCFPYFQKKNTKPFSYAWFLCNAVVCRLCAYHSASSFYDYTCFPFTICLAIELQADDLATLIGSLLSYVNTWRFPFSLVPFLTCIQSKTLFPSFSRSAFSFGFLSRHDSLFAKLRSMYTNCEITKPKAPEPTYKFRTSFSLS